MAATLPLDFEQTAQQAARSLQQALQDGHTRIALDIQNFRRTGPALTKPLLKLLPLPFVGIFGTGNAGLGKEEWGKGQWTLLDSGEALDYLNRISWKTMLLMDASSIENGPMRQFWKVAGEKTVLMVSCWPEAPGVIGLGRGSAKNRAELREQITVAYYLQAQRFQPLVIQRAYPGPWQLWRVQGKPELIHEQEQPFSYLDLPKLSRTQPWYPMGERWRAFWGGPQFFRAWEGK